ncbi:hypothetical protein DPMN_133726 [Dreissena polymorpha]|uniref:C1q domain-containing protein n=1 Tax=Dreissena polymorpha TaxID=45954 RepID=A0A9D4FYG7_DREPO|nr:hypothetical protein DPMN_133726 [Dreissena polymorpha]
MNLQKKGFLLLLDVILAFCSREPLSPTCMLYEYEERLLERVLRNEIGLENTLKDIVKTHVKVEDALKQLEDGKVQIKSTLEAMKEKQATMDLTLREFMENITCHVNLTLTTSVNNLENKHEATAMKASTLVSDAILKLTENVSATVQMFSYQQEKLKAQSIIPTIYFYARLAYNVNPSNQDVIFPTVTVNEGQGYNPGTGRFTVSVPGMYLFSVQMCVTNEKHCYLEIVQQGTTLQRSVFGDKSGYHSCVTMQAAAHVASGDQIWVRATSSCYMTADSLRYNSFLGALIHV